MYEYGCKIVRVIDGDTVEAEIDLGFDVWLKSPVRLYGINAPELKGVTLEAATQSKNFLTDYLFTLPGKTVLQTHGKDKDKYGRVLGTLLKDGKNVSEVMLTEGFAVVYKEK